jgi:transketolase
MTDKDAAHRDMADAIRALAMGAVPQANSGRPGMPMGMPEAVNVHFSRFLKPDMVLALPPRRPIFISIAASPPRRSLQRRVG